MYSPFYNKSWALVIGINQYERAAPLAYACNDADSVAQTLVEDLDFDPRSISILKDQDATKHQIMNEYHAIIDNAVHPDDRVLIFFAGHGVTHPTVNGNDAGFLVPFDGDPEKSGPNIRWDDLTRNADLIIAKHVLFIMDTCYSGLVLRRATRPGTHRFVSDILQRRSRQVLTAGKAEQLVADGGGPEGKNSIFTGYLLQGVKGEAFDDNGVLTANGLMNYVYRMVGQDTRSEQTPAYGHLDGDGDFVLQIPDKQLLVSGLTQDFLVRPKGEIPSSSVSPTSQESRPSFADRIGYADSSHPHFGRNEWTAKLFERRIEEEKLISDSTRSKAYSWLSLICEPVANNAASLFDFRKDVIRFTQYRPIGSQPYERFILPEENLTTAHALVMYDRVYRTDNWRKFLRVEKWGNIEYAESYGIFYDWNQFRNFKYVQIIGTIWQFIHFTKTVLVSAGYSLGVNLLINVIGTQGTILTDFAEEPGEGKTKWANPHDRFHFDIDSPHQLECHDPNLQFEYPLTLNSLSETTVKELIDDVAENLGLAYNHQSKPRCFNYNTDIFPWNQFLNTRR